MSTLDALIGSGTDLTISQMVIRGFMVFVLALAMLRIAGRRCFGVGTPFDRVVTILLGAILSRAVSGASPFVPTIITCAFIVMLHRVIAWIIFKSPKMAKLIEGEKILLFINRRFIYENHKRALVRTEDIYQAVRKNLQTEDMNGINKIYIERNGEICAVKESG
jgi:uncharacterized membrane protein YcaP (DUF421 family)